MTPGKVLRLFEDGNWHTVEEVAQEFHITSDQAESIIELLDSGGFIKFDRQQSRAIIKPEIQNILSDLPADEDSTI